MGIVDIGNSHSLIISYFILLSEVGEWIDNSFNLELISHIIILTLSLNDISVEE